ncbi:MAG: hypothetical protein J6S85_13525 [Methanobrevibacter sp.]|nr:hypothetical protein [Methanobrevibacter sp.]
MFYDLPREIRIALEIGLIVFVITFLLGLVVWCIIKHMIIHHRKRICKHEQSCTLCDKGYCIKCDGHKKVVRPETERAETPCRKADDNCIIVCEKNGEEK